MVPVFLLTSVFISAQAAEFAYMVDVRGLDSSDEGNGASLAMGYNGFGLTGAVEYKSYPGNSFTSAYIGIRTLFQLELGVSQHGASVRGGIVIPIVQYMDIIRPGSLHLTAGYENYLSHDNYSGFYAGLQWVIND